MRDKPEWLQLERYDFARDLDANGWQEALDRRIAYRQLWERQPSEEDSILDQANFKAMRNAPLDFFRAYLDDVLPEVLANSGRSAPRSPVTELTPGAPLPYDFVVNDQMRLLAVDLNASDADICHAFDEWLHQQPRGAFPRRGKRALRDIYTPEHGQRWHARRILAILDIELWCLASAENNPSHADLAAWLAPDIAGDPKQWGRTARDTCDEAMQARDALSYSIGPIR